MNITGPVGLETGASRLIEGRFIEMSPNGQSRSLCANSIVSLWFDHIISISK